MTSDGVNENTDAKTRRYVLMKSVMDIGMGLIYIGVGFMILFANKIGLNNDFAESTIGKIFAGLIMLYGAWRIYRGGKKNYLKER